MLDHNSINSCPFWEFWVDPRPGKHLTTSCWLWLLASWLLKSPSSLKWCWFWIPIVSSMVTQVQTSQKNDTQNKIREWRLKVVSQMCCQHWDQAVPPTTRNLSPCMQHTWWSSFVECCCCWFVLQTWRFSKYHWACPLSYILVHRAEVTFLHHFWVPSHSLAKSSKIPFYSVGITLENTAVLRGVC